MDKNYYTSDIENFAYSDIENASEQEYTWFQRFKHCYFGRLKSHQDDIKVVDERVNIVVCTVENACQCACL